jgi:hypothetical protein
VIRAQRRRQSPGVGYFLELAGALGGSRRLGTAARRLRPKSQPRPVVFFEATARNPFEALAAEERTPRQARRWGLLTGTPTDSFASYFEKVRDL